MHDLVVETPRTYVRAGVAIWLEKPLDCRKTLTKQSSSTLKFKFLISTPLEHHIRWGSRHSLLNKQSHKSRARM